jgi:site-specific DNA recombinase
MRRKVVTYIRVSTDEQANKGYSIPAQQQVLRDFASGHDLEVVEAFVESESAYKPGRPEYKRMLTFLRKRRDVTAVLCYKIDRIARNLRDYSELSEMAGVSIISATEALPENSTGQLVGTVLAASSRYYSDQLSERVKLGMETKARKGIWPSYAPIGYLNDPDGPGIIIDPTRAVLIREVYEEYVHKNISLSDLARWATKRGLKTRLGGELRASTTHNFLTNPIYCGTIRWREGLYEGIHQPLISKALFERVQERLAGKSHPRKKRSFPFRGLLTCGYCGCAITASLKKGKYIYYHCTGGKGKCSQPYIRQTHLSEMFLPIVEGVHMSEQHVRDLLAVVREGNRNWERAIQRKTRVLVGRRELIQRRRDTAYDDKADGKITEERWLELDRRWGREEFSIDSDLELVHSGSRPSVDDVRPTLELLKRAPVLYMKQNDDGRARVLKTLLWNCEIRDEKLDPIYRTPFDLVAKGMRSANWYPRQDSNLWPTV